MRIRWIPLIFTAVLSMLLWNACDTTKKAAAKSGEEGKMDKSEMMASDWDSQMKAYHDVMSGTFHPVEQGDFAPLKARYTELASVSKKWTKLPIPEARQGKGLDKLLDELATKSEAIGKVVEGGDEAAMKRSIYALHDVFHNVVGACQDH